MPACDGAVHAFLRGQGTDARGRRLVAILARDDAWLETVHDYIQWLFPLRVASAAVAGAPVLSAAAAQAIRVDPAATSGLHAALERMTRFYAGTDHWLCGFDHNHRRITRIIAAAADLLGTAAADAFAESVQGRNRAAGSPINPRSLAYWRAALAQPEACE